MLEFSSKRRGDSGGPGGSNRVAPAGATRAAQTLARRRGSLPLFLSLVAAGGGRRSAARPPGMVAARIWSLRPCGGSRSRGGDLGRWCCVVLSKRRQRVLAVHLGRAGGAVTAGDGCGARWPRGTRIRSEGIFLFNLLSPSSQIRSPVASGHRSRVSSRGGGWERGPEKSVAGYAGLPAATPMGAVPYL